MLLFTRAKHQNIVKVYGHAMQHVGERQVHQTLEGCWCICQTNRDNHILIQALRCQKCSFMLVTFTDANLMVGMAKVYQAKHSRFPKSVKQVSNIRICTCVILVTFTVYMCSVNVCSCWNCVTFVMVDCSCDALLRSTAATKGSL